jgi:hypothetical protein
VGTPRFVDPHYKENLQHIVKVDVYSFGVLLLVLVSGEEDVIQLVKRAKQP